MRTILYYGTIAAAIIWRRLLYRTTFIAIAGSYGKTTTKNCLSEILSRHFPTVSTRRSSNGGLGMAKTVLRARPRHRFVVVEVGIQKPGQMRKARWQLKPDLVVVTTVGKAHSMFLGDLEATAREKAEILGGLPNNGAAILNRDDPRVAAMAEGAKSPVYWFGLASNCDVWSDEASMRWPEGLRLRLHDGGDSAVLQTRLLGDHWRLSVTAAAASARLCGVSLSSVVEALRGMPPSSGRLEPFLLPSGATFIRDESNGSLPTLRSAMRVLRQTNAARRIALLSDFYDGPADDAERAGRIAEEALGAATHVVFLGRSAERLAAAARKRGADPAVVYAFPLLQDAAMFLREFLRPGDVALIKGLALDHMHRIYLSQIGEVECWLQSCSVKPACDRCKFVGFRPWSEAESQRVAQKGD